MWVSSVSLFPRRCPRAGAGKTLAAFTSQLSPFTLHPPPFTLHPRAALCARQAARDDKRDADHLDDEGTEGEGAGHAHAVELGLDLVTGESKTLE